MLKMIFGSVTSEFNYKIVAEFMCHFLIIVNCFFNLGWLVHMNVLKKFTSKPLNGLELVCSFLYEPCMNRVKYVWCHIDVLCCPIDPPIDDLEFETDLNLPNDSVLTHHCAPGLSEYFVAI